MRETPAVKYVLLYSLLLIFVVGGALPVSAQARHSSQQLTKVRARSGESLGVLADRFNVPVEELVRLNGGTPDGALEVGGEVTIPAFSNGAGRRRQAQPTAAAQPVSSPAPLTMTLLPPEQFPAGGSLSQRASFLTPYIILASQKYGIDPRVLWVICYNETRFQPGLTSPMGARGLTQLMPDTAARFGVRDSKDFRQALDGGAQYVRFLARLFNGNLAHILAGYNAGEGAVLAYLRGGCYVGGSGRRYCVTPQTKGFGTGIPQNSETVAYVNQGIQVFNGLTQARLFDPYLSQPSGAVQYTAQVVQRPAPSSLPASEAARPAPPERAEDDFEPTNSFYFGLEEGEAAPSKPAPTPRQAVKKVGDVATGSYTFP